MMTGTLGEILLSDFEPAVADLETEFLAGLSRSPKTLPCKFFYDERGSQLFDRICELDEYYVTRTELSILRTRMDEIAGVCGSEAIVVELGSGSSLKTRLLLDHLDAPVAYMPIDISRAQLIESAEVLNREYASVQILPVCADYSQPLLLPTPSRAAARRVIYFPGSTIGNFTPLEAEDFLRRIASWCRPGDGLLIGVDLRKDAEVLRRAYNDSSGVTAAFNLNLLRRANEELEADFDLNLFEHHAIYDSACGRIEMRLVSQRDQQVRVAGRTFDFERGEFITTEYSYKYRLADFQALSSRAGWEPVKSWTDKNNWFSVNYFSLGAA